MRYRDFKVEKTPGKVRVAVLGDSFTWGWGVSSKDRYTEIVENLSHGKIEVLNFGVSGFSPVQYYLMIDDILKQYNPDIVVVAFCLGNDFIDNVMWQRYDYYKPYATFDENGNIKIEGYPLPRTSKYATTSIFFENFLLKNSKLYLMARNIFYDKKMPFINYGQKGMVDADALQEDIYLNDKSEKHKKNYVKMSEINEKLLLSIKNKAHDAKADFAILAVSTKCEIGDCWFGEPLCKNLNALNLLKKTAERLDVELIDPTNNLTLADYYIDDGHWRASGHEKVGRIFFDWLEKSRNHK